MHTAVIATKRKKAENWDVNIYYLIVKAYRMSHGDHICNLHVQDFVHPYIISNLKAIILYVFVWSPVPGGDYGGATNSIWMAYSCDMVDVWWRKLHLSFMWGKRFQLLSCSSMGNGFSSLFSSKHTFSEKDGLPVISGRIKRLLFFFNILHVGNKILFI